MLILPTRYGKKEGKKSKFYRNEFKGMYKNANLDIADNDIFDKSSKQYRIKFFSLSLVKKMWNHIIQQTTL